MDVESPHFLMFSARCRECKINKRDGHRKLRNGLGKVMDKYFVKSGGTLIRSQIGSREYNSRPDYEISLLSCIRFTPCHVPKSAACPNEGKKNPIGSSGVPLV